MSAAATAAGYLYASGRLRGRAQREQEEAHKATPQPDPTPQAQPAAPRARPARPKVAAVREPRHELRVATIAPVEPKPRRTPTIQYRTRRWKPDAE
jgi:hypothetical protein